jgi:hypothetical protein
MISLRFEDSRLSQFWCKAGRGPVPERDGAGSALGDGDTQCDMGRRGGAGVPGVMAGVSAVLEKPLMQRIHANAPGYHAAGSRLADELPGGVRASCARCTERPHPRLG